MASILLATRLRSLPLPEGWYLLFDVEWDDIWPACGVVMNLWKEWGTDTADKATQDRWRRAWVLAESRKAVRKWLAERE